MTEKITIGVDADTSAFEKKISDLEKKIKNMRQFGTGGATSQLADQYRAGGQEDRAKRLEEFRERQASRARQELSRDLKNQENQLDRLLKKHQAINSIIDKQLVGGQSKTKILEREAELLDEINRKTKSISQSRAALGMDNGGPQGPGIFAKGMGVLKAVGGAMTTVGGLGTQIGEFNYMRAQLPARQAGRQVGITQGMTQLRERAIQGQNFEDIIFSPERQEAFGQTMDFFKQADSARSLRATGKAVGGIGLALGAGALAAGTVATGGLLPILAGGAAALGTGLGIFGGSEEAYYGLTGNQSALSQMTGQEAVQNFETFQMQQRLRDPRSYYQKKFLSENRGDILSIQRSGGLSDEQFYNDYMTSGAGQFLAQERMGMSQNIIQAGGSGAAATGGLQVMALQAQRSAGLTNAGQAMGRLSNYMNQAESEDAFVRIFSKGVTIGLDESQFREEQKDYFNQVTAIAQQIGGGEDMVSAALAAGVEGDISRRGIGMSADAFQTLENAMNQQGGVTAAARASLISDNEAFAGIKGMDRLAFQNLQMKDIRADNPVMEMYYKQAQAGGFEGSIEDFVNQRQDVQRQALFKSYEGTQIGDTLKGMYETGQERALTEQEVAKAQEMLKMIPDFAGKNSEEMKVITKQFLGTERLEEEASRKRAAALQEKDTIRRARQQYGEDIPMKRPGEFDILEGTALEQAEFTGPLIGGLTDQQKKLTGDFSGAPTGIDKTQRAQAQQQAKQFEGMAENMGKLFTQTIENLDQTLTDQIKMESFAQALADGAAAVDAFLTSLKGGKSQQQIDIESSTKAYQKKLKARSARK